MVIIWVLYSVTGGTVCEKNWILQSVTGETESDNEFDIAECYRRERV